MALLCSGLDRDAYAAHLASTAPAPVAADAEEVGSDG